MKVLALVPAVATLVSAGMTITVKQITPDAVIGPLPYPYFWPYYAPMPFLDPS